MIEAWASNCCATSSRAFYFRCGGACTTVGTVLGTVLKFQRVCPGGFAECQHPLVPQVLIPTSCPLEKSTPRGYHDLNQLLALPEANPHDASRYVTLSEWMAEHGRTIDR